MHVVQPRKPAARAYAAALKRGAKHEDILAAVKARVGVDKPDTIYAPMLVTWLNQDRWESTVPAAQASADRSALEQRIADQQRSNRERDERLKADRRRQLGLSE